MMPIDQVLDLYSGFKIDKPLGNNAFSYQQRNNKEIYVPPLIMGKLSDLAVGEEVAFSEMQDGIEINKRGLKKFIYISKKDKDIFIFDNHNHAFFFWMWAVKERKIKANSILVHIDQHADMRKPSKPPSIDISKKIRLQDVFTYTNFELNVGNFIKPAMEINLFSKIEMINSSESFKCKIPDDFILDIDLDIFAPELDYIDYQLKIDKITNYIARSNFITIATSPYFIEQDYAIKIIQSLFKESIDL